MDSMVSYVAGLLGISPVTLILVLGVVVAVCNLVGKLIPDDATGTLGLVRKVCKVLGLYVSTRITSGVTVNDTARVVAGVSPKSSLGTSNTVRSPALAGVGAILLGVAALLVTGCAPAALAGVNTAANLVCTSAPFAQALYNSAVATGDGDRINKVLTDLQRACPSVLLLIHTVPVEVAIPAPPPPPVPGPERG